MEHAVAHAPGRHAGETLQPAAARQAHQHGLRLVVGMMGGRKMARPDSFGVLHQKRIARLPGSVLDAGARAWVLSSEAPRAERRATCTSVPPSPPLRPSLGRKPWSTVAANSGGQRCGAASRHRAARCSSAMESGPPETARSRPIASRAAPSHVREERTPRHRRARCRARAGSRRLRRRSAIAAPGFAIHRGPDVSGGVGIFPVDLGQRRAGLLRLPHAAQRHGQLQQALGRQRANCR